MPDAEFLVSSKHRDSKKRFRLHRNSQVSSSNHKYFGAIPTDVDKTRYRITDTKEKTNLEYHEKIMPFIKESTKVEH